MKIGVNVTTRIAAHAALKTGIHGVEADYVASTSQEDQDLSDAEIPDAIARDTEVTAAVGAEATARALAIAAHSELASVHHTKFTNTEHDVTARHPLANLVSAVCSETEADGKVMAYHLPLTLTEFQANPATGTAVNAANINDTNTEAWASFQAIDQYCEIDLGLIRKLTQFKHYGRTGHQLDGRMKIQYYNLGSETWVDWVTGIATRDASWSEWDSTGGAASTNKIRIVATAIDTQWSENDVGEFEIKF